MMNQPVVIGTEAIDVERISISISISISIGTYSGRILMEVSVTSQRNSTKGMERISISISISTNNSIDIKQKQWARKGSSLF